MHMRGNLGILVLTLTAILSVTVVPAADPAFTVVLVPDTQNYSEKYPETYSVQTQWIKDRAALDDFRFVIHLGDLVQNPTVEKEWQVADAAHRVLDGSVAYSVLPGNHDGAPGKTTLYNKYFSPQRFEQYPWYGGNKDGKNDNNYCYFTAAGMKFMVLSLEYTPTPETLTWANQIVADHPDRRVIVATHSYMTPKGRNAPGNKIFKELITKHENIFLVIGGHVLGVNHQTSTNDARQLVHEVLCDYQGLPNGGDGWLQTMRFEPHEDKIYFEAYSPLLDKYNEAAKHTYAIDYDMEVVVTPKRPAGRPNILRAIFRGRWEARPRLLRMGKR